MRKVALIVLLTLLAVGLPVRAQEGEQNTVTISVTVPQILEDTYQAVIDEFEATNPGVRVEIVTLPGFSFDVPRSDDIEAYLDDLLEYVSSADVLLLSSDVGSEISRAGYILDLNPLVSSDPTFNPADFHESMLRSFSWDNGLWAIPYSGAVTIMYYLPEKFDEAGLNYPTDVWSLDDLENAIRALAEFDADGEVITPAFFDISDSPAPLLISLLGDNVFDETAIPAAPNYENPMLETLLDKWVELQKAGLLDPPQGEIDLPNDFPIQIGGRILGMQGEDRLERRATMLPGGRAGLVAQGFAVSAGTEHPDLAYALANFLSQHPNIVSTSFEGSPARPELEGVQPEGGGFSFSFGGELSPQIEEALAQAVENALPSGEMLFARGLVRAADTMLRDGVGARLALDDVRNQIAADLEAADRRRGQTNIVIQHRGAPVLAEGETVLTFGAGGFASPFPNQEGWEQAAEDFAANDPQVGFVDLNTGFAEPVDSMAEQYDCFYLSSNGVQSADLNLLLNLDPLMSADAELDPSDFVGSILSEVQVNGQTWALPITVQPQVLRYNEDLFMQAGVPLPENGWTIAEFEDALRRVKEVLVDPEAAPFQPRSFNSSVFLNLIAAYGGIPVDNRVDPPAINFTDPATVDAIRQVLDLAKDGLIQYDGFVTSGDVFAFSLAGQGDPVALYTTTLNGLGFGGGGIVIVEESDTTSDVDTFTPPENIDPYTLFPFGTQYNVVAMDLGTAYISANTQNADACYRFIKSLSSDPTLFNAMPARQSLIDDPQLEQAQNPDLVAIYRQIADVMRQPETVLLTSQDGGLSFILTFWLNRAFDRYVLEDADLEAELRDAETFTKAYAQCAENIEPIRRGESSQSEVQAFFDQITTCATDVDPTAAEFFN